MTKIPRDYIIRGRPSRPPTNKGVSIVPHSLVGVCLTHSTQVTITTTTNQTEGFAYFDLPGLGRGESHPDHQAAVYWIGRVEGEMRWSDLSGLRMG